MSAQGVGYAALPFDARGSAYVHGETLYSIYRVSANWWLYFVVARLMVSKPIHIWCMTQTHFNLDSRNNDF